MFKKSAFEKIGAFKVKRAVTYALWLEQYFVIPK